MALQSFKNIIDSKGYRISQKDREIFETSDLQSFFGLSNSDMIEFIVYDVNDNQLPQSNFGNVRYIPLTSENIRDYFIIADGTIFQANSFPKEYFVDVERLLNEAGYKNGIFKTQINLLNKRVGSDKKYDKLWISEISPSRTEVRLLPLKRPETAGTDLEKRFKIFIEDKDFREDTLQYAIEFCEKINPTKISSFIKSKYGNNWFEKFNAEFKINGFEVMMTQVYNKFIQSVQYEFTNRVSDINDLNYGKPKSTQVELDLSKENIKKLIVSLLIRAIDFYLSKPNVRATAGYQIDTDESLDIVGQVLQRKTSDTTFDTQSPTLRTTEAKKVTQSQVDLALEKKKKEENVFPEKGTLLNSYCIAFNKYGKYADGIGGSYEKIIEPNSADCGYRPDTGGGSSDGGNNGGGNGGTGGGGRGGGGGRENFEDNNNRNTNYL